MALGRKGYTITELMLTVAILATIAATSAPILVNLVNFWRQTTARNEIERDVRVSLDMINRMLRQAQAATVNIDRFNTSQPPYSRIRFTTEGNQNVSFYQEGDKLKMTLGTTTSVLSKRLGFIAFTYPRTDDITIMSVAMTMQAPTYLGSKKALQLSIQKVRIMN